MTEQKEVYRITPLSGSEEVNRILALIADRLDKLEGFRGVPEFQVAPTSEEEADESSELVRFSELEAHTHERSLIFNEAIIKTDDYTILATDGTILADATARPITITLPAAEEVGPYSIKKIDSSLNPVTVATPGTETIDGALTFALEWEDESVTLESDGINWYIV